MRTRLSVSIVSCWLAFAPVAAGQLPELPRSLSRAALAEGVPGGLSPVDFDTDDFALVPAPGQDPTIRARLERGSLRWVRVADRILVPRALASIETGAITAGAVEHGGFSHPLVIEAASAHAEVPVALLSAGGETLHVETRQGARRATATFVVRFRPRASRAGKVLIDMSCAPSGVTVRRGQIPGDSWLYVGCRTVRTAHADRKSATLELYLLWDHVGSSIEVDGMPRTPSSDGLIFARVSTRPGEIALSARAQTLTLAYFVPDPLHAAFAGAGLGPALYSLEGPLSSAHTVVPLLTLYAGYSFDPETRLVYFSALAGQQRGYVGQGLYLWIEQFRAFDDRLSLNLLLGANMLLYRRGARAVTRVAAPQGVELILRGLAGANHNLTVGGFVYPDLGGSVYYDGWLRWGSTRLFGELNFLYWREPHSTGSTQSQTLGLSLGMPLVRFL